GRGRRATQGPPRRPSAASPRRIGQPYFRGARNRRSTSMAYDDPSHPSRSRERERRERMRRGEDRDPYVSGSERRYFADRNGPAARAFEGARSYPHGGYPEETGYQHERRPDENDDRRATREAYEQGRGSGRYAAF